MMTKGYNIDDTREWDWSLNNADLARRYGISRERVRQIRNKLEIPYPKIRGSKEREVIEKVERLKEKDSEITVDAVSSLLSNPVSQPYLRLVLSKHKINYIHGNRKYPWEKINWNLPNITISDVWNIPYEDVVAQRNFLEEGDAIWTRDSDDPKFMLAVFEEREKVLNHNFQQ